MYQQSRLWNTNISDAVTGKFILLVLLHKVGCLGHVRKKNYLVLDVNHQLPSSHLLFKVNNKTLEKGVKYVQYQQ